ncbi:RNA-dependent RNA polymerase family protein [Paraburkholderia acidisoli]|uniref:Reverse transcriptase (RNA-dependent DNA polymerase) n=1 Tax=Paraburkholderia acidisoli TaxID=2571748 RepID=A0A7Z2GIR8_9BURK|nr:hypothetical protein [Paraburkholderia acidisoli]QGZ62473.1 hypothetical protein FAZ98_12455 [Paraburkholderia acidisoli]
MAKIQARFARSTSSAHLFVAASRSAPRPAHKLPPGYRKWRREALFHQRVLRGDIEKAALLARDGRGLKQLCVAVGRYLASDDTQLLALRQVFSQGEPRGSNWEHSFVSHWDGRGEELRRKLHPGWPSAESRVPKYVPKADGAKRLTWRFGPSMRARHVLVKQALEPLIAARLWKQMLNDGGRVPGLYEVREALGDPAISHYASVDVKAFFDSVDLRRATQILPLTRQVLENTVCMRPEDWARAQSNGAPPSIASCSVAARRPLALLQGAASSPLIAYYLLESAFAGIEDVFPYADNALILGYSPEDVDAKVSRYRSNLVEHPVGPLQLGSIERGEVTCAGGFDYLGVNFETSDNQYGERRHVRLTVSESTLDAFFKKFDAWLASDKRNNDRSLSRASRALRGFIIAMPTDDRAAVLQSALQLAQRRGVGIQPLTDAVNDLVARAFG